jgi:hypothetical protein
MCGGPTGHVSCLTRRRFSLRRPIGRRYGGGAFVGTVDERVAAVEARIGEQSVMMEAIRQSIDHLDRRLIAIDGRIDQRFTAVDQRFSALESRLDERFSAIDRRFSAIDQRFTTIDQRLAGIDGRFVALGGDMSGLLRWVVGIQVTILVAIIGGMLSTIFALR